MMAHTSIDQEHGLIPGKYKVTINAASKPGTASTSKPDEPGRASRLARPQELVPAKYNSATTLEAEVKPGGSNRFDFKLDAK